MPNRPHRLTKALAKSVPNVLPSQNNATRQNNVETSSLQNPSLQNLSLTVAQVEYYAHGWLVDCEIRQHSPATRILHRMVLDNLLWFLKEKNYPRCGTPELRAFLAYLIQGHAEEGGMWYEAENPPGRWGNPKQIRKVRPSTVQTYHSRLRTFFSWTKAECSGSASAITTSPMDLVRPPVCRPDQIQPFTDNQLEALLAASRRTPTPRRDEAILTLLLDTGVRASELCGLRQRDLDLTERRITVVGKGDKRRTIYFGQRATKALWAHLGDKPVEADAPLFPSEGSVGRGEALSRYGLRDLIERLKQASRVTGVRCSAHTFRHTFAVSFLRAGGQIKMLMEILGHTDAQMTNRYIKLAEADLANQRRFSPADHLAKGSDGQALWVKGVKSPRPQKSPTINTPKLSKSQKAKLPPQIQVNKIQRAKVTEDQVRAIKRSLAANRGDERTETQRRLEVADRYGLSLATVREIALGYTWRHVVLEDCVENCVENCVEGAT